MYVNNEVMIYGYYTQFVADCCVIDIIRDAIDVGKH